MEDVCIKCILVPKGDLVHITVTSTIKFTSEEAGRSKHHADPTCFLLPAVFFQNQPHSHGTTTSKATEGKS